MRLSKAVSLKKIPTMLFLFVLSWMPLWAQAVSWQPAANGALPAYSTPVGYSEENTPIFLARSARSGVTSLGWFDPRTRKAMMIGLDKATLANAYEVYAAAGRWVHGDANSIPPDAISAGKGPDGRPVYVLRVSSGGRLVPAVYSANDRAAVAFIGGKRMLFSDFEVLAPDWAGARDSVDEAFRGATDSDGSPLVPFRATQGRGLHPGKFNTGTQQGYISYGGKEIMVRDPAAQVFIGSGTWIPAKGTLPPGAIPAGYDDDRSTLYMIRAPQAGAQSLGKYNDTRREAYIPYGGNELKVPAFDVLCYDLSRTRVDSVPLPAVAVQPGQGAPAAPVIAPQRAPFPAQTNLVQDPSAEMQPVTQFGWKVAAGDWTRPLSLAEAGQSPIDGDRFFWPGKVAFGELYQDIPVTQYRDWLAGGVRASLEAFMAGFEGDPDTAQVVMEARDAGGRVLGSADTGQQNHSTWTGFHLGLTLPPSTASLRIRLIGTRLKGEDNDAYFDKISLVLDPPQNMAVSAGPAVVPSQAPAPSNPAALVQTSFGGWEYQGPIGTGDIQSDGTYTKSFLYDGQAGEDLSVSALSLGDAAQPTLQMVSPSGLVTERSGDTGDSGSDSRNISGPVAETGRYQIRVVSRTPVKFLLVMLQGRGQGFSGVLDSRSPVATGNVPYLSFELRGFNMANVQAIYSAEISADAFEPTARIVDRKTMSPWPNQSEVKNGPRTTITFEVDGYGETFRPDLSLLILVTPANPAAVPKPSGAVTVNVRMVEAGGS
jgi:hypothetical protein